MSTQNLLSEAGGEGGAGSWGSGPYILPWASANET